MMNVAMMAALVLCLQEKQDKVDNLEYKGWAKFKAGSWVKSKMEMQGMVIEETATLKSIDEKEAALEKKMVMKMGEMSRENKRDEKVPVKVDASKMPKISKEGDEEIEVAGKKLKCRWMEIEQEMSGVKTKGKIWSCEDVPGGFVKMEATFEGPSGSGQMTRTVLEWEKK